MMSDDISSDFIQEFGGTIENVQALVREAISFIEPEVNEIIRKRITDSKQVETLLDNLLNYAGMDNNGLYLFKRLCRYYYFINPEVTVEYVYTYRDLYDSDDVDDKTW